VRRTASEREELAVAWREQMEEKKRQKEIEAARIKAENEKEDERVRREQVRIERRLVVRIERRLVVRIERRLVVRIERRLVVRIEEHQPASGQNPAVADAGSSQCSESIIEYPCLAL